MADNKKPDIPTEENLKKHKIAVVFCSFSLAADGNDRDLDFEWFDNMGAAQEWKDTVLDPWCAKDVVDNGDLAYITGLIPDTHTMGIEVDSVHSFIHANAETGIREVLDRFKNEAITIPYDFWLIHPPKQSRPIGKVSGGVGTVTTEKVTADKSVATMEEVPVRKKRTVTKAKTIEVEDIAVPAVKPVRATNRRTKVTVDEIVVPDKV